MTDTINLTTAESAVLRELATVKVDVHGDNVKHAKTPEDIDTAITGLEVAARMWRAGASRSIDAGDRAVRDELLDEIKENREILPREHAGLAKLRDGDMDYCPVGCTQPEGVAKMEKWVAGLHRETAAAEALVAKFDVSAERAAVA